MHAHQQGGLRRRPLPAVYLQVKIAIAQQTPAAGRCNERHQPRVPPLRRSLARSASVRRPARAGQRLPPASRHPLERQTTLFVPLPARWALARPLPSDSRCPRAAALCQQPCQCDSHQASPRRASPARRGSNGAGLTSVARGPLRCWPWLKRWRRERRRRVVTSSDRQRGRSEGPATDFGLLAAVLKCPQSHLT